MTALQEVEVVVFDILGTLVDEPQGLRTAISAATGTEGSFTEQRLQVWQGHISSQQGLMAEGTRDFADSDVLDAEAAHLVAERAGPLDDAAIAQLVTASHRLPAWPDSAAGLHRIAAGRPVIGLSNASMATLSPLSANAGLRTAYVARPVADPPDPSDAFDGTFDSLEALAAALTPGVTG